jgi:RNA polymerase sigma factor (sigma-70 family)
MTKTEFNYQLLNYEQNLLGFAYSLGSNAEEARDLLQETYLKAISGRDKLSDYSKIREWTFSIMRNIFINNYRKQSKAREYVNTKENNEYRTEHILSDSSYIYNEILGQIDKLNTELRIPIKLFSEGYKYKEIAERLNLSIGTVKSRIHTARKLLSSVLKDF